MGWNSYNHFKNQIDDATMRAQAAAMVSSGMKAVGYEYVNMDEGWAGERDAQGVIHPNAKFPDMKALADYVHSQGLKLGLYSAPSKSTCGGHPGSFGHEEQDAQTYAAWGIDYLKYDLCGLEDPFNKLAETDLPAAHAMMIEAYKKMGDALRRNGPAHRLQPLPVRHGSRVGMGPVRGRKSLAHHQRHQGQLHQPQPEWLYASRTGALRRTGPLERSRHARGRQSAVSSPSTTSRR